MSRTSPWCKVRCGYMVAIGSFYDPCLETAHGCFSATRAKQQAKEDGWKILKGEWACPACQRELQKAKSK